MNKQKTLLLFCLLFATISISAQEDKKDFIIGQEYKVTSEILEQDRPILVYLPEGYKENEEKTYPVLYLLDGRGNFHHTTACVAFLARNQRIPEMIVIGIPNTDDRTRDLTPTTVSGTSRFPTAGGADKMLNFIEKELTAYVEKEYRTADYKMLVGHSFGGLFVTHTLLHHPDIFNSYISISPSLWWDEQRLVTDQTDDFFTTQQDLIGHLYMTMGNEGGTMLGGAWKLAALMEEKAPENFYWEFDLMEEETHGSIPHRSTYKGLEFIFADWNLSKQEDFIASEGLEAYEENIKKRYQLERNWEEGTLLRIAQKLSSQAKHENAVYALKKATEIAPDSEQTWLFYGEALAKTGQKEKAIENLEKVLNINPNNMQALVSLKRLGADMTDLVPDIRLTPDQLSQYIGVYDLEIGLTAHMTVADNQLWVSGKGIPKEALFALAEHTFYVTSIDAKVVFELKNGKAIGFEAESQEGRFKAVKKEE